MISYDDDHYYDEDTDCSNYDDTDYDDGDGDDLLWFLSCDNLLKMADAGATFSFPDFGVVQMKPL